MFLTEHFYNTLNSINEFILDNSGIIWGAFVQNSLLNKHYSSIYYNLNLSYDNYWDPKNDLETIDRIIIDDYINIHLNSHEDYLKLINFLNTNKIKHRLYNYGYDILLEDCFFDLLIIIDNQLPPYKEPLFISHCLIMYKNFKTNKIIIEFSDNTGLGYDKLPKKEKNIIKSNIIADIYKKRTLYLYIDIPMIFKYIKNGWNIVNMPYTILSKGSIVPNYNSYSCLICREELFNNNYEAIEDVAIIYSNFIKCPQKNYYPIHNNCIMDWIIHNYTSIDNLIVTKTQFTCPYRFIIDFNNFKYLLNYDYYKIK